MRGYKKTYPRKLKFKNTQSGVKVTYPPTIIKKRSPDIWALKYLIDKGRYNFTGKNIITLAKTDSTMALRLNFLPKLFYNAVFSIKDSFEFLSKDIIHNVNKRYKTYEQDFVNRGTKQYPESLVEMNIWNNLKTCFGKEFYKSRCGIRQFPANIFDGQISEKTRVTRKLWIDILTVNTSNQLSVLELKVGGNASLDLLAQAIDYGIFCHLFKKHIAKRWFSDIKKLSKSKVAIYCIAEKFHPALTDDKGVKLLIRSNEFIDIIFIQVELNKDKIKSYQILFDTRKL